MVIWGFKPNWFNKILQQKSQISQVFGAIDACIGLLDTQGVLTCMTPNDSSFTISNVKEAIYHQKNIYVLLNDSVVQKYDIDGTIIDSHILNQVQFLCGSNTHVLFSTSSSNTPLYGMGSNKLCQLGFDTFQQQQDVVTEPVNVDYFNELGIISDMHCGSFHSAIVLNGDVYTFGWRKDGKLGWGEEEGEDVIRCATFLDNNNESIEVNVIKVVCGTLHTLVLDDQHTVWSCGSSKFITINVLSDINYLLRQISSVRPRNSLGSRHVFSSLYII